MMADGGSGPKAHPVEEDWGRGIPESHNSQDIKFFFKQWGEVAPACSRTNSVRGPTPTALPGGSPPGGHGFQVPPDFQMAATTEPDFVNTPRYAACGNKWSQREPRHASNSQI